MAARLFPPALSCRRLWDAEMNFAITDTQSCVTIIIAVITRGRRHYGIADDGPASLASLPRCESDTISTVAGRRPKSTPIRYFKRAA